MLDTEEKAFLNAIVDAPDDDAPRLIFADWLEEQGDQRGPWVRDRELFAWMGPDATSPLPSLTHAWEHAIDALDYVAQEQREATLQRIQHLGTLLGRLGEPIAAYAMEQFAPPAPRLAYLEPLLLGVAAHLRPYVADLAQSARAEPSPHSHLALRVLLAGGSAVPAMLRAVFDCVASSDQNVGQTALTMLQQCPPMYRSATTEFLLDQLQVAMSEDAYQDAPLLGRLIPIVLQDTERAPIVLPVLADVLNCPEPLLVEAATTALREHRATANVLLGRAVRDAQPDVLPALLTLARHVVPDPVSYLTGLCLAPKASVPLQVAICKQLMYVEEAHVPRVVALFRRLLAHDDERVRLGVVAAVASGHVANSDFMRLLEEMWSGQSTTVKTAIVYAARDATGMDGTVVPLYRMAVCDPDQQLASDAVFQLDRFGMKEEMIDRLVRRAKHRDEHEQAAAVRGLAQFLNDRESLSAEVFSALDHDSPIVRRAIWQVLPGKVEPLPGFVKRLRRALDDTDARVRQGAMNTARALGLAEQLQTELLDLARSENARDRGAACAALVHQLDDPRVNKVLLRALRDDERVVEAVILALGDACSLPDNIADEILLLVKHPNEVIRERVQIVIRFFDRSAAPVQAAISRGLRDRHWPVVHQALQTVLSFADECAFAQPELLRMLDEDWPNEDIAVTVRMAVAKLPSPAPALVERLTHPKADARLVAYQALTEIFQAHASMRTTHAPVVERALVEWLPKERGANLVAALELTGVCGPLAARTWPFLRHAIERPYFQARAAALVAVGTLGPIAAPCKATLLRSTEQGSIEVRTAAWRGLIHLAATEPDLMSRIKQEFAARRQRTDIPEPPEVEPQGTRIFFGDHDITETAQGFRLSSEQEQLRTLLRECGLVPALAGELGDEVIQMLERTQHNSMRETTLETLAKWEAGAARWLPGICAQFPKERWTFQLHLVRLFERLGPSAAGVGPTLLALAEQCSGKVRWALIRALGKIPFPERTPYLGRLLNHAERAIRVEAMLAFLDVGQDCRAAFPDMSQALLNPAWDGNVDADGSVLDANAHQALYNGSGTDMRSGLTETLQTLGSEAAPMLPTLAKLVRERNVLFVEAIIFLLEAIGPAARTTLELYAKHVNERNRAHAQEVLTKLDRA